MLIEKSLEGIYNIFNIDNFWLEWIRWEKVMEDVFYFEFIYFGIWIFFILSIYYFWNIKKSNKIILIENIYRFKGT